MRGLPSLFAALVFGSAASYAGIGINYNWFHINTNLLPDCVGHFGQISAGGHIILRYPEPGVRATVQAQLQAMRQAGFTTLKTTIVHGPAGSNALTDVSEREAGSIREFVADISSAGFTTLEVAFGFRGPNRISCRRTEWGDCFEPALTDDDWQFIAAVTRAVLSVPHPAVRFDLTNEGCPAPRSPPQTRANFARYLQTIASRFQQQFGGTDWLVSCADSPRGGRVQALLSDLAQVGLRPKFIEVHSYSDDAARVLEMLSAVAAMARPIGAKIIFGEMPYRSETMVSAVSRWVQANPGVLVDAMEWPQINHALRCPVDTPPPYTPGPLLELAPMLPR